jgi:signal transduction histidine kinase
LDDEIVVSIKDTGTGIDSEILPKLFTKFTTKSPIAGTGLGLYLSKSLIKMHGAECGLIIIVILVEAKIKDQHLHSAFQ